MIDIDQIVAAIRLAYRDLADFDQYWHQDPGDGFISGQLDLAHVLLGSHPYDLRDSEILIEAIRKDWK